MSLANHVLSAGTAVRFQAKALRESLKSQAKNIKVETGNAVERLRQSAHVELRAVEERIASNDPQGEGLADQAGELLHRYFAVLTAVKQRYTDERLALEKLADGSALVGGASELQHLQDQLQLALESFRRSLATLETIFSESITIRGTETGTSSPRPIPWQIKYSAEFDPFPNVEATAVGPESKSFSAGVVEFEGGKITDKDGNDIWEDRCFLTGETIQSGAVGEASPRYRSVLHKGVVRAPWVHELQIQLRTLLERLSPCTEGCNQHTLGATSETCTMERFPASHEVGESESTSSMIMHSLSSQLRQAVARHDPYFWDPYTLETNHDVFLYLYSKAFARRSTGVPHSDPLARGMHAAFQLYAKRPLLAVLNTNPETDSLTFESYHSVQKKVLQIASGIQRVLIRRGMSTCVVDQSTDFSSSSVQQSGTGTKLAYITIGIWLPNCPAWLYLDWACAYSGLTSVGIHDCWPLADVDEAIARSHFDVIFTTTRLHQQLREASNSSILSTPQRKNTLMIEVDLGAPIAEGTPALVRPSSSLRSPIDDCLVDEFWEGCTNTPDSLLQTTTGGCGFTMTAPDVLTHVTDTTPSKGKELHHSTDGVYSLMFSSGTSGKLKAIPVSASTWYENNAGRSADYHLQPLSVLSYTSLAHGMDRGMCYSALLKGGRIAMLLHDTVSQPAHSVLPPANDNREHQGMVREVKGETIAHHIQEVVRDTVSRFPVMQSRVELNAKTRTQSPPFPKPLQACSQSRASILAASPDIWHSLWYILEALGVIDLLSYYRTLVTSTEAEETDHSTLRQDLHNAFLTIKTLILGPNVVQVATGAAPIDSTILADLKQLFSFSSSLQGSQDPSTKADSSIASPDDQRVKSSVALNPPSLIHAYAATHTTPFVNIYGATEAPGISTDGEISPEYQLRLRLVDYTNERRSPPEIKTPSESPASTTIDSPKRSVHLKGELIVKGPSVVQGYYGDEAETERCFSDGWYSTGDVVALTRKPPLKVADGQLTRKEDCGVDAIGEEGVDFRFVNDEGQMAVAGSEPDHGHGALIELINNPSTRFLLRVVGRANQFLELYVDHRSEWVPAAAAELTILASLRKVLSATPQDHSRSAVETTFISDALKRLQIHQVSLYSDRMCSRLIAVVSATMTHHGSNAPISWDEAKSEIEDVLLTQLSAAMISPQLNEVETPGASGKLQLPPSSWVPGSLIMDLDGPWSPANGLATDLGKLKRSSIYQKYQSQIVKRLMKFA